MLACRFMALALIGGACIGEAQAEDFAARCAALGAGVDGAGRIVEAQFAPAGDVPLPPPSTGAPAPDHCLVRGKINERTGVDGKPYAIGYELRLPARWNGKFFFQGGGGVDGVLRPAVGSISLSAVSGGTPPNGLSNGYAVASTDAGHLAEPGPTGDYLFGLDPQARADKGYNSIPTTAAAARAVIAKLYGSPPARSYFVGCSNGGRQGMMATQRYPDLFDGVVAGAPAYRVPLAAIDGIGHTKELLSIAPKGGDGKPDLGSALTKDELRIVADAILDTCDGLDGVKDGMVQNMAACTFDPARLMCKPAQNSACLSQAKTNALARIFAGTRNSKGEVIYSKWPWDPGIASPGWAIWRLGTPGAQPPNALNVRLVPGSVAYDFMSPPEKPTDLFAWSQAFDFDKDTAKIMRGAGGFEAGMEFEAATSPDLDRFRAHGGKVIFFHGTADPIFSPLDTIAYLDKLKERYGAEVPDFARLFLIPGMNHCSGGPATDAFDALSALDTWVEKGVAPETILAKARKVSGVPWPERTRPLCAWPKVATYKGSGDVEEAASFDCR
jgi:pimeloyl-ACP methyl ester carboxylesterase